MILRDAAPADIAALAAIAADVYALSFRRLLPQADLSSFDAHHFARRFANSLDRIRLAERDDACAGFCLMTGGNIDILFIARGLRGAGVGAALLRDAERLGARTLECFAANSAACRFYEREGWTIAAAYAREFAGASHSFVRFAAPSLS